MENQTRVQKIEEARKHLKYKENILEFEQPRVDVTDPDAEAPPRYCKKFELEKVQALQAHYVENDKPQNQSTRAREWDYSSFAEGTFPSAHGYAHL